MQVGERKNTVNLTLCFTKWINSVLGTIHFFEVSICPIFRLCKKALKTTFSGARYSNISFLTEVLSNFPQ